jgi:hypothetical protein
VELVVLLAITAGVIGLVGRLPEARRVKREVARARIQSIASLPDGTTASIRGKVAFVEVTSFAIAPFSGKQCVYWLVTFDEVGVGGDYVELGRIEDGRPFLVEAEGAFARVVPERPRIALPGDAIGMRPATALDFPTHHDKLIELARSACKKRPNYPTSWLRATEYVVLPGMLVTVLGWCTREPDPGARADVTGYRAELPTRPVISGSRRVRLVIST